MSKRTIDSHEDDFCQIQLLPARNRGHCAQQLGELSEFAEARRAPGGGWTEVYMRQDEPESIASLALRLIGLALSWPAAWNPSIASTPAMDHAETPASTPGHGASKKTARSSSNLRTTELFSTSGWAWEGRVLKLSDPC